MAAILHTAEDIRVVGEATDGLEATLEIKNCSRVFGCSCLPSTTTKSTLTGLSRQALLGLSLKRVLGRELIDAVRSVDEGEVYLYPAIAKDVVEGYLTKDKPAFSLWQAYR